MPPTDPFAAPVGYGGDRFENGTEYAREQAELAQYAVNDREVLCTGCFLIHRPGRCDQ